MTFGKIGTIDFGNGKGISYAISADGPVETAAILAMGTAAAKIAKQSLVDSRQLSVASLQLKAKIFASFDYFICGGGWVVRCCNVCCKIVVSSQLRVISSMQKRIQIAKSAK